MERFSQSLFDISFRILIVLLPFVTVISVFTSEKLWIPGLSFLKELLLVIMGIVLVYNISKKKINFRWNTYDTLFALYWWILVLITLFTTRFHGIIYGGRYDFSFFIAFLLLIHGYPLLQKPISYYLRIFLISSGIALVAGMSLKWPFSEDWLLYLGFSGNPSNWQFGGSIPIFHGVDGANVRRLQGIFDGPNTMWAYLLIYMGILTYYFRMKKNWYFVLGIVLSVGVMAIYYTYSRSALLGLVAWVGIIILFSLGNLWKKYKIQMLSFFVLLGLLWASITYIFSDNMRAIFDREGSTKGHSERMLVGYNRFLDHPFWQGLGSAGPAYRYVMNLENTKREDIENLDRFYIPESWYIQQFIEWGFIIGFLFLIFVGYILWNTIKISPILGWTFLSVLVMNFFLHTFESSLVSLSLFLLLGLFIGSSLKQKHVLKK